MRGLTWSTILLRLLNIVFWRQGRRHSGVKASYEYVIHWHDLCYGLIVAISIPPWTLILGTLLRNSV